MALRNAFGELGLDETLQLIVIYLEQIAASATRTYPDTNGRMQVNLVTGTLPTLTNQNQQSGYSTAYDQYCQLQMSAECIRNKIVVS